MIAITRPVSRSIDHAQLTHIERQTIDYERAVAQHEAYERALGKLGCFIERLPADDRFPDGVFVEDTVVVFDELAVITRPGAESRRGETASMEPVIGRYRTLHALTAPATLDGGDVLVVGSTVWIGRSTRTNDEAIEAMRSLLVPRGYEVNAVEVEEALHLKTAVTCLRADDDPLLLINPDWIAPAVFPYESIDVDPGEPFAANALAIGETVIYSAAHPSTAKKIAAAGFRLELLDVSELAKAEAGVTCCSVILYP